MARAVQNGVANSIKIRPQRRITQAELDGFLEKAADLLRGGVDHSEFRGYVFALLFYKRINDVYLENVAALEKELGNADLARDPRMHDFVVPDDCIWERVARTSERDLGKALNDAMRAIERANAPKFDGILANSTVDFNAQDRMPRSKLVAIINHFGKQPFDHANVPDDVFGNAYEYLILNFASHAGKQSGEFYTPKEIGFLMSEIVQPEPGDLVGDWASGSASLLLQCRRYVERRYGRKAADRIFFYMQETNPSTANIARINMYLHGVRGFHLASGRDSLRAPFWREGQTRRLRQFDRIVMNPPFSLKDWGYADFVGGDPYDRFGAGMPPNDNGDYAWLQQVVKSLKPTGRAIVVMSQGVLFRDQPEQTMELDGRNEKAGPEYIIRRNFVESDLIECVIVMPSKIFYGNTIPACLIVMNKRKVPERQGKILMIWASRYYKPANPQNLLRRADCLRILVAWRGFGDLERCRSLIPEQEKEFVAEVERERDKALLEIDEAYGPLLEPLPGLQQELAKREMLAAADPPKDKTARQHFREEKKANTERLKQLKAQIKDLTKLEVEAGEKRDVVRQHADRDIGEIGEAVADLIRICSDSAEAGRYFAIAERVEIDENEFNLNLPRYIDTFEPEEQIEVDVAIGDLDAAESKLLEKTARLRKLLKETQ